ncbi:unnamed protein product [Sphagnum troendelagicum]
MSSGCWGYINLPVWYARRPGGSSSSSTVVREEAGGIVLEFHGGLAKEHKGPGGREVTVNFPFVPNVLESLPRNLSHWAIK